MLMVWYFVLLILVYRKYAKDVRFEYKHVDMDAYLVGRTKVLHSLSGAGIFKTKIYQDLLEDKAKDNLRCEIEALKQEASFLEYIA